MHPSIAATNHNVCYKYKGLGLLNVLLFNTSFNNMSVISWRFCRKNVKY